MKIKFLFLIFSFFSLASAQMIDTIREKHITTKDAVSNNINIFSRMVIRANQPQRVTKKGKKIKNGYDKYYIHVIRSSEVWVKVTKVIQDSAEIYNVQNYFVNRGLDKAYLDSAKISNRNNVPIYLAIATKTKKLGHFKEPFVSNAVFLKGMVDNTDSLIRYYENEIKNTAYVKKIVDGWVKQKKNLYPAIENQIIKLTQERNQLRGGTYVEEEDTLLNSNQKHKKDKDKSKDTTEVKSEKDPQKSALEQKKWEERKKKEEAKNKEKLLKQKKKEAKKKKKEAQKKKKEKPISEKKLKRLEKKAAADSAQKRKKNPSSKPKETKNELKIKNKNLQIKEFESFRRSVEWIVANNYEPEREDSLIYEALIYKKLSVDSLLADHNMNRQLYKDFKSAKGSDKKILKFFLSHYFAVSLKYTIRSNPYGLPKFIPEDELKAENSRPEEQKHKVKKKGIRKLFFWKRN